MPGTQPKILFLQVDQLAAKTLGAYGNPICKTPHLDRLAGEALRSAYAMETGPESRSH